MARIGINPARGKVTQYRPAPITICLLIFIPDLSGYFEYRLQVLQLVLASLWANTSPPHDLMVFDNGSCDEIIQYLLRLKDAGQIDYLLLSKENRGKIDALRTLFNAAPGEIIAYSDDDILFYPGWLEAQLDILESYPNVGMVSGAPVRNAARHGRTSLDRLIAQPPPGLTFNQERRIPDDWEIDWALSTGRDPETHMKSTRNDQDMVLKLKTYGGNGYIEAIGSANHFQFIAPKHIILQALPKDWTGKLMGNMIELDEAVDELGYLRLSTVKRYTRHLGNSISQEITWEIEKLGRSSNLNHREDISIPNSAALNRPTKGKHWLLRIPGSRRVLAAAYHSLFKILYD